MLSPATALRKVSVQACVSVIRCTFPAAQFTVTVAPGVCATGVAEVTSAVREATRLPIITKLSPNVTDIVEMARAAVEAGADALSLINTLLGMAIDVEARRPVLGNAFGGLSGPAIKPVALRMVYQVAKAVDLPILGGGGIMCARDAIEFMMAGATAVSIGTGTFVNPRLAIEVIDGIQGYLAGHHLTDVRSVVGAAIMQTDSSFRARES